MAFSLVAAACSSRVTDGGADGSAAGSGGAGTPPDAARSEAGVTDAARRDASAGCVDGIAAGVRHTCARTADRTLWCWGYDGDGQLGRGMMEPSSPTPVPVGVLGATVVEVAAGGSHTCARRTDGTLWCWGAASGGQLGDGADAPWRYRPGPVPALGTRVVGVAAGSRHTCARLADGSLQCWGDNTFGQLGDRPASDPVPAAVPPFTKTVVQVSAGDAHTCAVGEDGSAWCWGWNGEGQVGDGTTTTPRLSPARVEGIEGTVAHITAGGWHTCALTRDHRVWCWGRNDFGQIGDGTPRPVVSSPVEVTQLGADVSGVSAGRFHTCARKADGTLWCWGQNDMGQLGDGTSEPRATPGRIDVVGGSVAGVASGGWHTCALRTDATVACWGSSIAGALGEIAVPCP